MRLTLEVPVGPDGPRSFVVEPGREVRVGRDPSAEIALEWDRTLSRRHFALTFDGTTCRLRDLESTQGTLVNDALVVEATLADGDQVLAGGTLIRVRLREPAADDEAAAATVPPVPRDRRVIETLRSGSGSLYAVLDAARDPAVLGLLMESGELFQSLFEAPKAMELASVAPYLVALPADSAYLERLVREGWGKSWGSFLVSGQPFAEVRKHLRRSLTVELAGQGRSVHFRFYDPRVLRAFLPTCNAEELQAFFGPLRRFDLEAADPSVLLRFERDGAGALVRREVSLQVASAGEGPAV